MLMMTVSGIAVCSFSKPQTRNALSKNIVAQVVNYFNYGA